MMPISLTVSGGEARLSLHEQGGASLSLSGEYVGSMPPPYAGSYSVAPGASAQTLATEGKFMEHDVVVGAIPSNYGLITWNGSVLLVS